MEPAMRTFMDVADTGFAAASMRQRAAASEAGHSTVQVSLVSSSSLK